MTQPLDKDASLVPDSAFATSAPDMRLTSRSASGPPMRTRMRGSARADWPS